MKVVSLSNIPLESVSHNKEIVKQVLIRNGDMPHVTQLARVVFKPGQIAPSHSHLDMFEVFYVEAGSGEIKVNENIIPLDKGSCVVVEKKESHEVANTGDVNLVITVLGVEQ